MSLILAKVRFVSFGLLLGFLTGCFHPPYNNFRHNKQTTRKVVTGTVFGAAVGGLAGSSLTGALIGGAAGGTIGMLLGIHQESKPKIVKDLKKRDIQFIEYGDTMTLIIPTDKYFMFESPRLNEICYPGLNLIVRLLKLYPKSPIYVAGFTDNVGSRRHKRLLSQAQAETILTYLWANNIQAYRLKAEGYGDKNDIAENSLIHGSAQNRRIEIQWFTGIVAQERQPIFFTK